MVAPVKNSCISCTQFIFEPYSKGLDCIFNSCKPEKKSVFFLDSEFTLIKQKSLKEKVSTLLVGLVLLIPVINYIFLAIFKAIRCSFIDSKSIDLSVSSENPWKKQTPTIEEAIKRQKSALERIEQIKKLKSDDFKIIPSIDRFDLDLALQAYNTAYDREQLMDIFTYANIDLQRMHKLTHCLTANAGHSLVTDNYFSIVYDFLNKFKDKLDPSFAPLFKEKISQIADKIIDMFTNCRDQVLTQLEELMLLVLNQSYGKGGQFKGLLLFRAATVLFKYKSNLLKTEIAKLHPNYEHQADLYRKMQQYLASDLGTKGQMFNDNLVTSCDDIDPDAISNSFKRHYDPFNYLLTQLKHHYGSERTMRNDLLNWTTAFFGLDIVLKTNPSGWLGDELTEAISDDKDNDFIMGGGDLSLEGLIYLLEEVGIIQRLSTNLKI